MSAWPGLLAAVAEASHLCSRRRERRADRQGVPTRVGPVYRGEETDRGPGHNRRPLPWSTTARRARARRRGEAGRADQDAGAGELWGAALLTVALSMEEGDADRT